MNAYTIAQMAAEETAARKQERTGNRNRAADTAAHGYGPHRYEPETPPQWELVTRLSDLPCISSLVLIESRDGQIGLKVNGQRFNNGRVRLAVKKRPYNVKPDEVLIPLR